MPEFEKSHKAHSSWYDYKYKTEEEKLEAIERWKKDRENNTVNHWLQERYMHLIDPFIKDKHTWLTVGDPYGFDAHYLINKKQNVVASDIANTFFPLVKKEGIITDYAVENAESLSFQDNTFDYILCKESYHHFPRPYLAVYEMIRVAKEAVILIEPQDPVTKIPLLLALCNLADRINPKLVQMIWKNRYSFEVVGNYVFKLSEREVDKLANGIGLPAVAFKGIHNNFYNPSIIDEKADNSSSIFKKIKRKLKFRNLLTKMTIISPDVLCAVIFKTPPSPELIASLKDQGFAFHPFPANPYL